MEVDAALANAIHGCARCSLAALPGHSAPAVPGADYETRGFAVMVDAADTDAARVGEALPAALYRGRYPNNGAVLDRLLGRIGLDRSVALLMNRVRCAPPGNRTADYPDALFNCDDWTRQELAAYSPLVVVLMGAIAIKSVFGAQASVGQSRGKFVPIAHEWGTVVYTATYSPAACKRDDQMYDAAAQDLFKAYQKWAAMKEAGL